MSHCWVRALPVLILWFKCSSKSFLDQSALLSGPLNDKLLVLVLQVGWQADLVSWWSNVKFRSRLHRACSYAARNLLSGGDQISKGGNSHPKKESLESPGVEKIRTDPLVKTRPKKSFEILYDKIDQSSQLQATLANPTSFCWQPKWLYGGRSGKSMHLQRTRRNQGTRQSWRQDQKSLGP